MLFMEGTTMDDGGFYRRETAGNLNNYPETCEDCGQERTCNGAGLCHECQQSSNENSVIVDEEGQEWVPGGYAL